MVEVVTYGRRGMRPRRSHRLRRFVIALLVLLVLIWAALPMARAVLLLQTSPLHHAPPPPRDLAVQPVHFGATDGVSLEGWWLPGARATPSIILIPGFKDDRASMLPYARFLHRSRFNVLLYDPRGTGGSGGRFTLGVDEVRDVVGAVRYMKARSDLSNHQVALLGVSMGAGDAIVAEAQLPGVGAVVADSAYADQRPVVDRLDSLRLGSIQIPQLPLAPWTVDRLIDRPLASFSPLRAAFRLHGRPLLLIHSRHDTNPTTPLSDVLKIQRSAGTATLWIAPRGGHAGALTAQPAQYSARVVGFLRRAFGMGIKHKVQRKTPRKHR